MREVGYELDDLRWAGYSAGELQEAVRALTPPTPAICDVICLPCQTSLQPASLHVTRTIFRTHPTMCTWLGALSPQGFDAAALKESGTSLLQLKLSNTPTATLKEAGYRADRLRTQGYTAGEIALGSKIKGGYTAKEVRARGPPIELGSERALNVHVRSVPLSREASARSREAV
jgi:hypothetical protein